MGTEAAKERKEKRHDKVKDFVDTTRELLDGELSVPEYFDDAIGTNFTGEDEGDVPEFDPHEFADEAEDEAEDLYKDLYDRMDEANAKIDDQQTFTEWMADEGNTLGGYDDQMAGIQGIIDNLTDTEGLMDGGYENAARMLGLDDAAQLEDMMGTLTNSLVGEDAMDNFQGLSDEEMDLRRRENQSNIRIMEDRAMSFVQDSLAESGMTARMLMAADEATMAINNAQIQQDAQLALEDSQLAIANFQSQKEVWANMLQTQQIGVSQYVTTVFDGANAAMQGYVTQMNAIVQQNQEYFNQYAADFQATQTQITNTFNAIGIEMGLTQAEIATSAELYAQKLAPYLDDAAYDVLQEQLAEMQKPDWGGIFSGVAAAAGTVMLIASGGTLAPFAPPLISSGLSGLTGAGVPTPDLNADYTGLFPE